MTIFSRIIAGEIPSYKVAENDRFIAFLDIAPLVKGHVLVVPKIETDKISALSWLFVTVTVTSFTSPLATIISLGSKESEISPTASTPVEVRTAKLVTKTKKIDRNSIFLII